MRFKGRRSNDTDMCREPTDVTGGGAALVNGGYYHNTCGLMVLSDSDAVNDQVKAKTLVAQVESICEPYLHN
jgi:hypothetical protein